MAVDPGSVFPEFRQGSSRRYVFSIAFVFAYNRE